MGNGRVETAMLPEGYIPLGTAEYGGIIYIVSYNPFTNKSQVGSFPSPERNITSDEISSIGKQFDEQSFYKDSSSDELVTDRLKIILTDDSKVLEDGMMHPGDKYQIYLDKELPDHVSARIKDKNYTNFDSYAFPRHIAFKIVAIGRDGQVTDLTDYATWNNTCSHWYYMKYVKDS